MRTLYESIFDNNEDTIDNNLRNEVQTFLERNYRGKFTISKNVDKDGKYKVTGTTNVYAKWDLSDEKRLTNGMFKFTKIKGDFSISECPYLETLDGCPVEVGRAFYADGATSLKSLKGAPKKVGGYCSLIGCSSLTSLEGAPEEVGGNFSCEECESLVTLKGAPKQIKGSFYCDHCPSLKSLEGFQKKIEGSFSCNFCPSLTSLEGAPEYVAWDFECSYCNLKSLKGMPKYIGRDFNCEGMGFRYEMLDELGVEIVGDIDGLD